MVTLEFMSNALQEFDKYSRMNNKDNTVDYEVYCAILEGFLIGLTYLKRDKPSHLEQIKNFSENLITPLDVLLALEEILEISSTQKEVYLRALGIDHLLANLDY